MGSFAHTILLAAMTAATVTANGCNAQLPQGVSPGNGYNYVSYKSKGVPLRFLLHLPNGYANTQQAPVILSYHGGSKTAEVQEALTGFSNPGLNPNAIAVYPQAIDGHFLSHPGISQDSPNDWDFTLDLLDWLDDNLCIDKDRVYATGKSNGGGFVNLLACNSKTASRFAAFALVSGAYYIDAPASSKCAVARKAPMLTFHGADDTTIPYTGKVDDRGDYYSTYDIDTWLRAWAKRLGCSTTQSKSPTNTTDMYGGLVDRSIWTCGGSTNLLTHYKERELGHVWASEYPNPDCPAVVSTKCPKGHYTFNATNVIMDFFSGISL